MSPRHGGAGTQQQWCTGYEPGGCCCSHPSSARERLLSRRWFGPAALQCVVGLRPRLVRSLSSGEVERDIARPRVSGLRMQRTDCCVCMRFGTTGICGTLMYFSRTNALSLLKTCNGLLEYCAASAVRLSRESSSSTLYSLLARLTCAGLEVN